MRTTFFSVTFDLLIYEQLTFYGNCVTTMILY